MKRYAFQRLAGKIYILIPRKVNNAWTSWWRHFPTFGNRRYTVTIRTHLLSWPIRSSSPLTAMAAPWKRQLCFLAGWNGDVGRTSWEVFDSLEFKVPPKKLYWNIARILTDDKWIGPTILHQQSRNPWRKFGKVPIHTASWNLKAQLSCIIQVEWSEKNCFICFISS